MADHADQRALSAGVFQLIQPLYEASADPKVVDIDGQVCQHGTIGTDAGMEP
jgi:hypothetical protein